MFFGRVQGWRQQDNGKGAAGFDWLDFWLRAMTPAKANCSIIKAAPPIMLDVPTAKSTCWASLLQHIRTALYLSHRSRVAQTPSTAFATPCPSSNLFQRRKPPKPLSCTTTGQNSQLQLVNRFWHISSKTFSLWLVHPAGTPLKWMRAVLCTYRDSRKAKICYPPVMTSKKS